MAKKPRGKKTVATARSNDGIDESALTRGELRKLNALRKSVGDTLGEQTFAKWLEKRAKKTTIDPGDKNADLISDTIMALINEKGLRIPRGGYIVTRGRGRIIIEQAK